MIIIPTEKRFDWKHAPIALFVIVLINIFIYFIPQSDDNIEISTAYIDYKTNNYLNIEWPFLKKYLNETNQLSTLEKLNKFYEEKNFDPIIAHILFDQNFYHYLRKDQYSYFLNNDDVGEWFFIREKINNHVQGTTTVTYGLVPSDIKVVSLISYQFLHGSVMHLLGNLFFLIVCGFAVEAAIGHWRFALFYLLSGIVGGLLHAVFYLQSAAPLVGASGAISGAMAMYLGVFRFKKIEFFYWFFVFVGYFRAPAMLILIFYIGKELYQFFTNTGSNTAFLAHTGGFIAGALLIGIAYWYNRDIFNEEYIEEDQSIDPLQEKKATIYDFLGKYQFDAAEKAIARLIDGDGLNINANVDGEKKIKTTSSNILDFELAFLRYNVEKIDKKEPYKKHLMELLTIDKPSEQEANQLLKVWQENKIILQKSNVAQLIKIALNLSEASSPKQASLIFDKIYSATVKANNTQFQNPLAVLAKKLADAYSRGNNIKLQQKYNDLKQQLLAGA